MRADRYGSLEGFRALGAILSALAFFNTRGVAKALEEKTPMRDFFVTPSGSDGDDGSAGRPWASLAYAARQLQPGDRVTAKAGTYPNQTVAPRRSGEIEKPIVYRAEPGGRVVLDGALPGGGCTRRCFSFEGQAFSCLRIEGFEIVHYDKPFVFEKNTGPHTSIELRGLKIHHCQDGLKVYSGAHADWLIADCHFHHLREAGLALSGERMWLERCVSEDNDDGLGQKGDADGFHVEKGGDLTFIDCLSQRNAEDGFDIKPSGVKLIRCRSLCNGNNYKLWGDDVRLTNCVSFRAKDSNFTCGDSFASEKPFVKTLIHCTLAGAPEGAHGGGYGIGFSGGRHKVILRNCLIADVGRPFYAWRPGTAVTVDEDYNVFQPKGDEFFRLEEGLAVQAAEFLTTWRGKCGGGRHSVLLAGPDQTGFVNFKEGDLRLKEGSQASGAGLPEFSPKEDVAKTERLAGAPDCGAYGRLAKQP